jgi:hypothetical protein
MSNIKLPAPAAQNNSFVLDDGTKEITLVNPFGKVICKLYIRTSDVSILDRYNALVADFDSIVKPLQDIDLKGDGTVSFDKDWAALKRAESMLIKKINALFDMEEAEDLFATRNPFSSVGGKFFIENVLDVLGQAIVQAIEEEAKLSQKRVNKHLKDLKSSKPEVTKDAGATSTKP